MHQLVFRQVAAAELRALRKSTELRWGAGQAQAYVAELRDRINSLRDFPLRFPEFGPERPGLRKMRCGSHVVYYLGTDVHIEIVRILHEQMDLKARLGR